MKIKFQHFIYFIFLLVTFSGAIRKWVIPYGFVGNATLGLILIAPLMGLIFISKEEKNQESHSLFAIYVFFLFAVALNPLNQSIYHGIFGFFIHLVFFSLILNYLKNKASFNTDSFIYMILASIVIEVILGSIQSISSADSFINRYAVSEDTEVGAAIVGDAIRVTGTFSYIAGYSSFQFLGLFASLYLIKTNLLKQYSYIFLLLVIYGALISGSRGTVGFIVVTTIVFLILEAKVLTDSKTIFNILSIAIILFFVNFITGDPLKIVSKFSNSYNNFMVRAEGSQEEGQRRIFLDFKDILFTDYKYKLTGIGLGSTYQGANALFGTSPLLENTTFEGEQFRLVIEGGFILFLFRLLLLWHFLIRLEFSKLFKIYLFLMIILVMPIVFNIYTSIFLALGLIVLNQAYLQKTSKNSIEEET